MCDGNCTGQGSCRLPFTSAQFCYCNAGWMGSACDDAYPPLEPSWAYPLLRLLCLSIFFVLSCMSAREIVLTSMIKCRQRTIMYERQSIYTSGGGRTSVVRLQPSTNSIRSDISAPLVCGMMATDVAAPLLTLIACVCWFTECLDPYRVEGLHTRFDIYLIGSISLASIVVAGGISIRFFMVLHSHFHPSTRRVIWGLDSILFLTVSAAVLRPIAAASDPYGEFTISIVSNWFWRASLVLFVATWMIGATVYNIRLLNHLLPRTRDIEAARTIRRLMYALRVGQVVCTFVIIGIILSSTLPYRASYVFGMQFYDRSTAIGSSIVLLVAMSRRRDDPDDASLPPLSPPPPANALSPRFVQQAVTTSPPPVPIVAFMPSPHQRSGGPHQQVHGLSTSAYMTPAARPASAGGNTNGNGTVQSAAAMAAAAAAASRLMISPRSEVSAQSAAYTYAADVPSSPSAASTAAPNHWPVAINSSTAAAATTSGSGGNNMVGQTPTAMSPPVASTLDGLVIQSQQYIVSSKECSPHNTNGGRTSAYGMHRASLHSNPTPSPLTSPDSALGGQAHKISPVKWDSHHARAGSSPRDGNNSSGGNSPHNTIPGTIPVGTMLSSNTTMSPPIVKRVSLPSGLLPHPMGGANVISSLPINGILRRSPSPRLPMNGSSHNTEHSNPASARTGTGVAASNHMTSPPSLILTVGQHTRGRSQSVHNNANNTGVRHPHSARHHMSSSPKSSLKRHQSVTDTLAVPPRQRAASSPSPPNVSARHISHGSIGNTTHQGHDESWNMESVSRAPQ